MRMATLWAKRRAVGGQDVGCSDGGMQLGMRARQYYDASPRLRRWDGDRRSVTGGQYKFTASLPRKRGNEHLSWRRMWGEAALRQQ